MGELLNPNICRFGIPLLATALLLGSTACESKEPKYRSPTTMATSPPIPKCVVRSEVKNQVAVLRLDIKNGTRTGYYDVDKALYNFGDGTAEEYGNPYWIQHTYKPGLYAATAEMIMKVSAYGHDPGIAVTNGEHIVCIPTTFQVW